MIREVEYMGAILGICGTLILAMNNEYSGWGFVIYLFANLFLFAWAQAGKFRWIMLQQGFFFLTSVYGIYKWLL